MPAKQPQEDQLIPVSAAAEMTGLAVKTLYAGKCKTDELLRIPIGARKFLYSRNDVLAWIERRKTEAIEAQAEQLKRKRSLLNHVRFNKQTVLASLQDFKAQRA